MSHEAEEHLISFFFFLRSWFYESGKQEVWSYLRQAAYPFPAAAAVNMKAAQDLKRYLVPALGNINHTLFGCFSLIPPLPCGQL